MVDRQKVGAVSGVVLRNAHARIACLLNRQPSLPAPDTQSEGSLLAFTYMLESAATQSGRPNFGLELARLGDQSGAQSTVSRLFRTAPTVGDALRGLIDCFPAIQTATRVELKHASDRCDLIYSIFDPSVRSHHEQDAVYTLTQFAQALSRHTKAQVPLMQVCLTMSRPVDSHRYTETFGAPDQFNASHNVLALHPYALLMRLETGDAARFSQLCRDVRQDDLVPGATRLWEDALRAWIVRAIEEGDAVTLELACSDFGMSPRTMQRRLRDLGINFLELRARTRMYMARKMLRETTLPMTCIAQQLGFSEASAFTRAFGSAEGCSPQGYRKRSIV